MAIIYIDDREGSKELADLITDAILVRLEYADASFVGSGPDGMVNIGVERKRIGDLVNSIATGRLSGHQLPGLLKAYFKVYIIVEGLWRQNACNGELEVMRGRTWKTLNRGGRRFSYAGIWNYLNTLEVMTGVIVRATVDARDTAAAIECAASWWGKPWERHRAHVLLHKSVPPSPYLRPGKAPFIRRVMAELPGVGYERAVAMEKKFGTMEDLVVADEADFMEVEGIGAMTANRIWNQIHGREG